MKARLAGVTLCASVVALAIAAPVAAQPGSLEEIVHDSPGIACDVLGGSRGFRTGNLGQATQALFGVVDGVAQEYGITRGDAVIVVNAQVSTYCPQLWPMLAAIGAYARAR
ncbi:hypothetical protein EB72_24895 [Mycobacterium sp. SWH-M1]|nr:hypothetical protein EB72_24895 [Mycobacterium sp. SWH-M1]